MGVCSYCKKYRVEHEECFGWGEAKTFCGIARPVTEYPPAESTKDAKPLTPPNNQPIP